MRPSELPEMRARAVAARESEAGRALAIKANQHNALGVRNASVEMATHVWRAEKDTLKTAALFHVSDEMSRLSVIAAHSLTDFHLRPWDAPSQAGLMWFESPIATSSDGYPIRAASWWIEPTVDPEDTRHTIAVNAAEGASTWLDPDGQCWAAWVTFYTTPADFPGMAELLGPICSDWEHGFTFGDGLIRATCAVEWLALVSAWLLMGQQIADVVDLALPPTVARKYRRRGYDRKPVRVVTIAPPPRAAGQTEGDSAREYHHRWVVRGHWRNHWFPKQKRHVPLWINPHIKGPKDAPILDRQETVYAWKGRSE